MNFESKIRQTLSNSSRIIDKEQFINNLTTARHEQKLKRSQAISGILAACLIIIIGVGDANFDAMEQLDDDRDLLIDDRRRACNRNIVQFVEFREAVKRGNLAEQVLHEIPNQI